MQLTGLILFIGATILFLLWAYNFYFFMKYKHLLENKTKEKQYYFQLIKGICLFISIAISAGMAWG